MFRSRKEHGCVKSIKYPCANLKKQHRALVPITQDTPDCSLERDLDDSSKLQLHSTGTYTYIFISIYQNTLFVS